MYATIEDVEVRCRRMLTDKEKILCDALLSDAAIIIDNYRKKATDKAKQIVSCNMVVRALGSGTDAQIPFGASQGTMSALGYSQTWTYGSGSSGELYLTKTDKGLLGLGKKMSFSGPLAEIVAEDAGGDGI